MVATIAQIIGKINPKLYASNGKDLLKKYKNPEDIPAEEVKPQAITYTESNDVLKFDSEGIEASHGLTYESYSDTLEPVYYFLLDLMEEFGLSPEKLVDNFSPTPGSTQFSELGTKATAMQQQATKSLGDINTVLRSVLNIIYDLRDFQVRLHDYDNVHSDKQEVSDAARLALKQLWMDKVDMQKGNSSIKALGTQGGFITLIDAFLASKTIKDVERLDLNERIKRILIPRLQEFENWIGASEQELRKRFEIEKNYLRTQVNSLQLYARWAKPYLIAAQQLETTPTNRASLVKAFNRTVLELTLLGKSKLDIKASAVEGSLPEQFQDKKLEKRMKRNYYSCVLMDFVFTAVPKQGTFIGKAEVVFRAYALNEDEVNKLNKELKESDIGDVLKLIEGATDESINQLKDDINGFLEGDILGPSEKAKEEKPADESNPFLAMIGFYGKDKSKKKPGDKIEKDNYYEENFIRPLAALGASDSAFTLFDVYKKAHGMESFT